MMRGSRHGAAPYEAPPQHDLMPYVEQLQTNLTLAARAIVQLDRRVKRLEQQVSEEPAARSTRRPGRKASSWGRGRH